MAISSVSGTVSQRLGNTGSQSDIMKWLEIQKNGNKVTPVTVTSVGGNGTVTNGSTAGSATGAEPLIYDTTELDAWKGKALEQLALNLEKLLAEYDNQKPEIQQNTENAARQAYVQYMQAQRALPQTLSMGGQNGGMAESTALGLQTGYGNQINDILLDKNNQMRNQEFQKNVARMDNAERQAGIEADYLQMLAEQKFQEYMARLQHQQQMALLAMQQAMSRSGGGGGYAPAQTTSGGLQGKRNETGTVTQVSTQPADYSDSKAVQEMKNQISYMQNQSDMLQRQTGSTPIPTAAQQIGTAHQQGKLTKEEADYLRRYYGL